MSRRIPRELVVEYNRKIKRQGDAAEKYVDRLLRAFLQENPGATAGDARDFAFELLQAAGDLYGNACSQAALDLQYEIADMFGAAPPSIGGWLYEPDADSIARTAQKHAKALEDGDAEGFVRGISEGARYYAERGANSTMAQTARRQARESRGKGRRKGKAAYGVRFARVPMGPTNCDLCIMLASRGFVYLSEESAGEFDQYHPHCDCRIVPSYGDAILDGYDPEYYLDCYEHPEDHPEIRDARNARRREQYAERQVYEIATRDAAGQRTVKDCRNLVKHLDTSLKAAWRQYQEHEDEDSFNRYVNGLLKRVGDIYGIAISADYAPENSNRYMQCPAGEEVFAVCRTAGKYHEAVFLTLSKEEGTLNVDLMMDGKYVDVKSPESTRKIGKRLNHALRQCRQMGQEQGISIISDLNYKGESWADVEEKAESFVASGAMERVTIVRMVDGCYDL